MEDSGEASKENRFRGDRLINRQQEIGGLTVF